MEKKEAEVAYLYSYNYSKNEIQAEYAFHDCLPTNGGTDIAIAQPRFSFISHIKFGRSDKGCFLADQTF